MTLGTQALLALSRPFFSPVLLLVGFRIPAKWAMPAVYVGAVAVAVGRLADGVGPGLGRLHPGAFPDLRPPLHHLRSPSSPQDPGALGWGGLHPPFLPRHQ